MMPNRDLSVLANEELYSCGVQGLVEVEVSRSTLTLTHSISMSTKFIITQREHAFLCIWYLAHLFTCIHPQDALTTFSLRSHTQLSFGFRSYWRVLFWLFVLRTLWKDGPWKFTKGTILSGALFVVWPRREHSRRRIDTTGGHFGCFMWPSCSRLARHMLWSERAEEPFGTIHGERRLVQRGSGYT